MKKKENVMDFLWKYIGSTELVILSFTVFCGVLLHGIFKPLFYWSHRGVPSISAFPIVGSILDSLLQRKFIGEIYMEMYQKLEGKRYGGFLKFTKPSIILRDPEIIKIVLEKAFPSFHDNDLALNEEIEPMFGRNLFVATGEQWKQLRSHLSPAFTTGKIRSIYPLVQEVCGNLNAYLEVNAGSEIEMKDLCARFTTEVVSSCAFGVHSDAIHMPNSEFRLMALEMLNPSPARAAIVMFLLHFPWTLRFIPITLLPDNVTNFFRRLVREVAVYREREGIQRNDFMDLLIQLKKDGKLGRKLEQEKPSDENDDRSKDSLKGKGVSASWDPESIDDVAAQALGFFVDGSETSATLMSFAFFELAHNCDIQEKLRTEIKQVRNKYEGEISYDALQEMSYLEMVLLETLRKYPPASFMARLTTKPFKLPSPEMDSGEDDGKVLLQLDTPVIIPVLALHRDPKYYPDSEVFDPERFSEENRRRRERFVFLPFGEGPRICIGKRFGLMQSKAAIATVLLSYELLPSDQTLPPVTFDPTQFLTSSSSQLWVYVKKLKT
ncbi:hypothetical protein J437_LFUL012939 [Ladona fulva]|uniref:Cytochrome P450 n=1 Tax=Ladona fulva TaxID=123851 RepID=A0A8K0KEV1_LADFU|nr:hypothetical protein J437_LFUL012939 [Ladona fulva]